MSALQQDEIPIELRALPQWVLWRFGAPRQNGKRTKCPLMPDGKTAKVNDHTTWSSFEAVIAAFPDPLCPPWTFDGVGFVLSAPDDLIGVDLDECISDDGTITAWALRIVDALPTYWERSPSGRGLHAFLSFAPHLVRLRYKSRSSGWR